MVELKNPNQLFPLCLLAWVFRILPSTVKQQVRRFLCKVTCPAYSIPNISALECKTNNILLSPLTDCVDLAEQDEVHGSRRKMASCGFFFGDDTKISKSQMAL
jgi:hypothetical protein